LHEAFDAQKAGAKASAAEVLTELIKDDFASWWCTQEGITDAAKLASILTDDSEANHYRLDDAKLARKGRPTRYYCGHVQTHSKSSPEWVTYSKNEGHLGILDEPNNPRLYGQQVFVDKP